MLLSKGWASGLVVLLSAVLWGTPETFMLNFRQQAVGVESPEWIAETVTDGVFSEAGLTASSSNAISIRLIRSIAPTHLTLIPNGTGAQPLLLCGYSVSEKDKGEEILTLCATEVVPFGERLTIDFFAVEWSNVSHVVFLSQESATVATLILGWDTEDLPEPATDAENAILNEEGEDSSAQAVVWVEATSPSRECPVERDGAGSVALIPTNHVTLRASAFQPFTSRTFGVAATTNQTTLTAEGALRFRNNNARVLLGQPAALNFAGEQPCAISAWIRPEKKDGLRNIVARGFIESPKRELFLRFNGGNLQFGWWCTSGTAVASAPYTPALGIWAHVMGVFDGVAYALYVNGVEVARTVSNLKPVAFNADWAVGRHPTQVARYFYGDIAEVSFYKGSVFPEAVSLLAQSREQGISEASVRGIWSQGEQLVVLTDTVPPEVIVPADKMLPAPQVDLSVETHGRATATDVASEAVLVTSQENAPAFVALEDGSHRYRLTRTWIAEDATGLESIAVQTLDLTDTVPPELTAPADISITQRQGLTPEVTGFATATDNAGLEPELTWRDIADTALGLRRVAYVAEELEVNQSGANSRILGETTLLDACKPFTLTARMKPAAVLLTKRGDFTLVSKGHVSGKEVFLRIENGTYQFGYCHNGNHLASFPMPPQDVDAWVSLAGTWDGRTLRLYRDGVCVAQNAPAVLPVGYSARWVAGRCQGFPDRGFIGTLSNVGIWSRALTERECAVLATSSESDFATLCVASPESDTLRTVTREWIATDSFGNFATAVQTLTVTGAYADADADGLCDVLELEVCGTDPDRVDTDGDTLSDFDEVFLHCTDPLNPDTDGDHLPDAWELQYGFNPCVVGETFLDPDGDGLANVSEWQAGTHPLVADTDGDGLSDGLEVLSAHSDPLKADIDVSDPEQQGVATEGNTFITSTGSWKQVDGKAIARERSGTLTYRLSVPSPAPQVLAIKVEQQNDLTEQSIFELSLKVDGLFVARFPIAAPKGSPTEALFFLPLLEPGEHTFTLAWHNWRTNSFIAVHGLRFLNFDGPDSDGNGRPDWQDTRTANVTTVAPLPEISFVSPICIEGTDVWRDVLEIRATYPEEDEAGEPVEALIPVTETIGEGFYADIPLSESGEPVTLTLDDRRQLHSFPVAWAAFDVTAGLTEETPFPLRKGDALRLFGGEGSSLLTLQKATAEDDWATVTNLVSEVAVPYAFEEPGFYRVISEGTAGGGIKGVATMEVTTSRFPQEVLALMVNKTRTVECPALSSSATLDYDASLDLVATLRAAGGITLSLAARLDRNHGLVSRLGEQGAILDAAQVRPVWGDNGNYYRVLRHYSDGSQLTEVVLQLGAVPPGLKVKLEIFVAGVTFEDGTRIKWLTAEDFDDYGICRLTFIRGANVKTSVCHRTYFYQDNTNLGVN